MKKGYIFDMDGTLVDSMEMISRMDESIFEKLQLPFTEEAAAVMRYIPLGESAKYIHRNFNVPYSEEEITNILLDTMKEGYKTVGLKDGAVEYLEKVKAAGGRIAVATATETDLAKWVLRSQGLDKYVEDVVSCTDVGATKTKPDVFIEAARRVGLEPCDCAVYEDGLPGAKSSKSAGFFVVGVYDEASSAEQDELKSVSHVYVKRFDGLLCGLSPDIV